MAKFADRYSGEGSWRTKGGVETEVSNPYGNHFFVLEISGTEVAHFVECSGLKSNTTVFEIEEGGTNGFTHKRPGQSTWENIVLRTATSASLYLLQWRDALLTDQPLSGVYRPGAIHLKNNAGDVIRTWAFTRAWPVSWEGPSLNASGSELAIESLEIAHDGLQIS